MTDMLLETPTPLLDDTPQDPEDCKHLVDQHKNQCNVTEARVLGIEVVALCGYKWIPSKDPEPLPMCQACSKILAAMP